MLPKKLLVFGGEALQSELVENIRQTGSQCTVVNHYGPTETTIGKLLHVTEANKTYNNTIPIGKPFSNTQVYVLSKDLQLTPQGVPGQLYIAGDGVARGYLNNEELTKAKFIKNPYSKEATSLMYGTGDLVKYLPDGNIEFIGRVDDQVKIRGYRVELGEIESILQQSELVSQGVVLAREDKQGNKRLVGYVVAEDGWFDREGILSYLKEKLPEYMVPSMLVELESLPLTANGKVDRKALPDPEATEQTGDKYVAPRNDAEARLTEIWQDVLEEEKIGVNDNFFELGGHSLLAVRLISAIRKEFAVEIPISHVFDYPTVALLAAELDVKSGAEVLPPVEAIHPRPERIPLSFSQERLWFIDKLEGSVQYHVPAVVRLQGKLNREALGFALQQIVARHEVLRTIFLEEEGKAFQVVQENVAPVMQLVDGDSFKDGSELEKYIKEIIATPFNLSEDAMLRAHLIILGEEEHVLVVTVHHIASDGWSRSILVEELADLYAVANEKRESNLISLPVQYADFSLWQRSYLQGETFDKKLGYWKNKLQGVAPLNLPTDHVRPSVQGTQGDILGFQISKEVSSGLLELSQKQGVTMYMTLLSAFNVLLYRYSNQQDICVGTPIAGRLLQELEGLIGFFVNTLTIRTNVDGNISFTELLDRVKTTTLEAYANQEIPFEKVVEAVVKDRETYRNPLFQVMFILRNTPDVPELRLGDVVLSRSGYQHNTSLFDLSLFITETENGLFGSLEYSTDIFTKATIERMVVYFTELLNSVVERPNEKVGFLNIVSQQERTTLLVEFNETKAGYTNDNTIVNLFEEQVLTSSEDVAVVFEKQELTYRQLNERSNKLASYLKSKGVQQESLVAICVDRGIEMIVGILGILKAGAAFVPIDPEYPQERIKYILDDIDARIVLSTQSGKLKLVAYQGDIIELDIDSQVVADQPVANLQVALNINNLAYIIYTSGSTGRPKGVMIEHKGVVNTLKSISGELGFNDNSVILSVTTYSFDIFYVEFFMPLITGGKLIVVPREIAVDGFRLAESIRRNHPTHIQATPSTFQLLLESGWENKEGVNILMGGEAIRDDIKEKLLSHGKVWNGYGPTETTIYSTIASLQTGKKVLIGRPIANTKIYILSKEQQLCGIGIAGELCISGVGLGRGYINRPELTEEKFVKDPFSEDPEAKMYKTGDSARWINHGEIEYLGRIDYQVKIRGYRIELGEIESVLLQSGYVTEAVVIAKQDIENNRLISYYTPDIKVVKAKEGELYQDQVNSWKDLYEVEYSQHDKELKDEEFDIGIWKDSFTGLNIPEDQMREWVSEIAELILSEQAGEVLEIGCGTGLIYYQLAGKVKKYIGTDFSASSINQIRDRINKGLREYGPTELVVSAAHEIILCEDQKVDTVVINSVIQYFPGESYMSDVIAKSISLLKSKGRIIIGDVRDKRLLDLFKGRLQLQNLQRSVSVREFNWVVDQEVLKEEELCFSPDYFYNLKSIYPQITYVEITWKQGSYTNELSLYRYNVIIYVGDERSTLNPEWESWHSITSKRSIVSRLNKRDAVIGLKDVPNFRLYKERSLDQALKSGLVTTIGEVVDKVSKEEENFELMEVLEIAKTQNYRYRLLLDEDPLTTNILFELEGSKKFIEDVYSEKGYCGNKSYTNIPLYTTITSVLQKELRALLHQKLPDYMVPSDFVALSRLPLTANGKVDRMFLSTREDRGVVVNKFSYQAARTMIEHKLNKIWQQLLGIDVISVYDNFFDLGGHSLLGMRLISAIRKELDVELSIKDLFNYPTIASLSTHLGLQNEGALLSSIEVVNPRPAQIPLSFSQERLWFIDRLEGTVQYHIPAVLRLKGSLNIDAINLALQTIVNRHEVLRTVFIEDEGNVYQQIKEAGNWNLNINDGTGFKEDNEALKHYIGQLINKPFNLSEDDMLRADLLTLDKNDYVLVVTLHHIASDGWSTSILVNELVKLYESYDKGKPSALAPLNIQYADFAIWQRNYIKGEVLSKKISYWKEKLQGVEPLQLPVDFARPIVQSTTGASVGFTIDKELTGKFHELSQKQGTTMFMTLLAAFKVLLFRHTGQADICVGTPIAGRQQQEVEGLIGFFVNTLALRDEVRGESSFGEFLQQVKSTTVDAYEHQEVPFEKVVEAVMVQRDMSRSPLFQVMFILQNAPDVPNLQLGEVELSTIGSNHNTSKFDITFSISETSYGLRGSIEYLSDLYSAQTIERFVTHYKELLASIARNPQQSISLLPMLTQQEQQQLVVEFNNTESNYPKDKTIVDLFEDQVKKTPGATAVVYKGEEITYKELNEKSNQLANYLVSKGVKEETLVPICIERSIEMIVGIMGILKAGGAYVPIDPDYPQERIGYLIKDTAATIIITNNAAKVKLPEESGLQVIEIVDNSIINRQSADKPLLPLRADHLAYLIYTSGSTGMPKGVMIEHQNVVRLFKTDTPLYDFNDKDVWTLFHSFSFDFSVWEIFGALFFGGRLIVVPKEVTKNAFLFGELIRKEKVTVLNQTPSAFYVLQEQVLEKASELSLRYVIFGGEALNPLALQAWKQQYQDCKLINMYGITETTVHVTYQVIESEQIKSGNSIIGKPIPTLSCYILDEAKNVVPVGVAGELYVGGAGVARGYLNRPELTAERFIKNIFGKKEQGRLYKTGDVGRWLANGSIEYLGRMDEQVKIRGYRIELGEIENVLLQSRLVTQSTVVVKEDGSGNKRLIAYVASKGLFDRDKISSYLYNKLPDYMVPGVWVELESLPLTPNGKIDKKALPDPDISELLNNEYVAPRNKTEEKLTEIWQELLGVEKIGVSDNFFELGGHSLLVMRIVSAIRKEFAVEIPIRDVFNYPTIVQLAEQLQVKSDVVLLPSIEVVNPRPAQIPLSFSQERLWFIDRLEGTVQYHIPAVLRLKGSLNIDAINLALQTIVNRHEVLRTVFIEDEGNVYQQIKEAGNWNLNINDGTGFKEDNEALKHYIGQLINKPFNLSEDDMLRADLLTLDKNDYVLVVTLHHIASDGWSTSILVNELVKLYESYDKGKPSALAPLNIQYADFAIWQRNYIKDDVLNKKISYWKEKLQGVEPLQVPVDFARPAVQSTKGASVGFTVDKELTGKFHELSQKQGTTMFMTLLAAFKVLLFRHTGQADICVGTPIAGRQQQEVEGLIGFFVNTLALRDEVRGESSFAEFLQQVKSTTVDAYEHQEVPFEKVVEAVMVQRDMSRSPLFQVMFILQNAPDVPNLQLGEVELSTIGSNHNTSKFDITFSISETSYGLRGSIEYLSDLYSAQTIERFVTHYKELLVSIARNPQQSISLLPMLTQQEQQQLVVEFNNTDNDYPADKSIIDLFEEQVKKSPSSIALAFEGVELTYHQLNERANQLAHYLINKGVKTETLVPICMERSIELIVGIMGILKAGGVYVPIDPKYPVERIAYMLSDTSADLVICKSSSKAKVPAITGCDFLVVDTNWDLISTFSPQNPQIHIKSSNLAYVIYTSGSTGNPKGVMVEHRGPVSLVRGIDYVSLSSEDVLLSINSPSFDATTFEYWSMLLNGGQLAICSEDNLLNKEAVKKEIRGRGVTKMLFTSSLYNQFVDEDIEIFEGLNTVLVGGEKLSEQHIQKLRLAKPSINIINVYGPTENANFSTTYLITETKINSSIPIGRAINNRSVYILDDAGGLVPIGVPGEINVSGAGLARGYLNKKELTKAKFVSNTFSNRADDRMYRTGDIGRWLPSGNIEYIGRIDDQVKVRGFRVELGEIESVILQSGLVLNSVVLARKDKQGDKRLVGYVVAGENFDKQRLVSYLHTQLPEYMVPAIWVKLETLPLTANGKIDKAALHDPELNEFAGNEYVEPRNETEAKLVNIWKDLLGVDRVGIHDNFFELGGHSLLVMRIVSAIRKEFAVEIPIRDVFNYPTIVQLAEQLQVKSDVVLLPSIEVVNPRPAQIPLSFSQERLWFIDRLEGTVQYHIPAVLRLKGSLNIDAINLALQTIVNRHEVLRTVFIEDEGHVYQQIKEAGNWHLNINDGTGFKEDNEALKHYIGQLINKPFNLSEDDMLRADLLTLDKNDYVLVVTLHHIASDGWSTSILVNELVKLYESYDKGKPAALAPLNIQYADFAIWQRNYIKDEVLSKKISYWKEKLQGVEPLQLPVDFARPAVQSTKGASVGFTVDKELTGKFHELSQKQGTTMFMTLLAAFKVLLFRHTGQPDICVGTPIAGRQQQEVEGLIGFFVNTLALRDEVRGESSFGEFLQQVKSTTVDAYEHQEVPFEKVVEAVMVQRDMSRSPLFQVMFILQNAPDVPNLQLGEVELSTIGSNHNTSKFDITFSISETSYGLRGSIEYLSDLYSAQTIERFVTHYKELLVSIARNPQQSISLLPMLTQQEQQQLVVEFNNTESNYPKDKTIVDLFEDQVKKTPGATAVVYKGEEITYKELNEKSNQLANYLVSKGVKEETLVPICIERSIEMIVGIMGILKAGGAYVPIDPYYPVERIGYMLDDIGASIAVSRKQSMAKLLSPEAIDIVLVDEDWAEINVQSTKNHVTSVEPDQLAYVIYTSGSTGKPKGVMVEQRSVVNLIKAQTETFKINSDERILQFSNYTFDASVEQIFLALFNGASLFLFEEGLQLETNLFENFISAKKITHLHATPSFLENLVVGKEYSLKRVIAGGDVCKKELANKWQHNVDFYNEYGPTETTVTAIEYLAKAGEDEKKSSLPVGKPISNTSIYIVDKQERLVPVGVFGEIYIGGSGVARGYLNLPELTSAKFITDIFTGEEESRLYKTGDLGRWLVDGDIEYLGRIDDQVKIRGYRIELGEIESVIMQSGLVSQAVVDAKHDGNGNKHLVGYVVAEGVFDKQRLIVSLEAKLPGYMVPALWVQLESLPLTSNGKVDRQALPDVDASELLNNKFIAPRNETEQKLCTIWQQLLGVDQVGVFDNFFELGGHSLMVMRIVSAIRKEFAVEIPIRDIFNYPTIAQLAEHLQVKSDVVLLPSIEAVQPRPERIPLSFSQERLWFLDRLEGSIHYHIPIILRLKGSPNKKALAAAFQSIIKRHEALRTCFLYEDGQVYQKIKAEGEWQLRVKDATGFEADGKPIKEYLLQLINEPFDLSKDHMIRAELININNQENILVVTLHHIASDAWSMSVLVKEFTELYQAYDKGYEPQLVPLKIQYVDYAIWQRHYIKDNVLDNKISYWKEKLKGVAPLQLPTDFLRPVIQSTKGAVVSTLIDKQLTENLQQLSQQQGVTMFMVLLSAFKVLLYRYSGQKDICVGTPIANRQQQELEDLIGFFVNTLALRTIVDGNETFTELLQNVKATTLEGYEHQDVPFEKVVDAVMVQRDMTRNPLFQVMFVLQNTRELPRVNSGEAQLSAEGPERNTSKFDITFFVTESHYGLRLTVEYAVELYEERTITRLISHFKELLVSITAQPEQNISLLPMLSKEESQQLLIAFNDTKALYPDKTIVDLFEEQVVKSPEDTSLVFDGQQITYLELNERANRLAHYLQSKGIKNGMLVPVCIERSVNMIVGVLGVLKAGATYVPIDPEYPSDRISYMLEDCGAGLVVSSARSKSKLKLGTTITIVDLDTEEPFIHAQLAVNLPRKTASDHLAYVIYTSGSTGRPKGVKMPGSAMVNLLTWQQEQFVNKKRRVLQFASLTFDVSFQEIFSTICFGSTLYLIQEDRRKDMSAMLNDIGQSCITHLFVPFVVLKSLVEHAQTLSGNVVMPEEIIVAGEQLKLTEDIRALMEQKKFKLINHYGPTEAHVVSSYVVDAKLSPALPPIGKPINNTRLYVLGEENQLCPVNVPGQLFIGGVQVAAGYLNREDLTAEKFVPDLFSEIAGARLYKTGDLARWLPDGNLEYLGRIDEQVKVRGYRIELGEIESVLQQSDLVKQAVVLAKEDPGGNKRLVAYIVPLEKFDKHKLIAFLHTQLPEYMVPGIWLEMETLPVTNNGKIDKKALPNPEVSELVDNEYVAPGNETEAKLANIWKDLLGVDRVGIHDNFFELGGHSLVAVRLVSLMNVKLEVQLTIKDLFLNQTVYELAKYVQRQKNELLDTSIEFNYLLQIKKGGDKIPLYIVSGGGGTVLKFRDFAQRLDERQPVYGLQQPNKVEEVEDFPETVEGIAATYIEEILQQNPHGPYALSGHCVGGVIAFEMAKQLEMLGKKVTLLAMFDTIIRTPVRLETSSFKNLYHIPLIVKSRISKFYWKAKFETYLLRNYTKHAIGYKVNKLKSLAQKNKRDKSKKDPNVTFRELELGFLQATQKYQITPYNGDIIAFYAEEHYRFLDVEKNVRFRRFTIDDSTKNIWKKYAKSFSVYEIEGEHSTIFVSKHAKEFSRILQAELDKYNQ